MKLKTHWIEKMKFETEFQQHKVGMDTQPPLGSDTAMTPKQLVVAGLCGCTAMDVVAYLKKHQQPVSAFEVEADVTKSTGGYPEVFTKIDLIFKLTGSIDPAKALEAVHLSQTKYCGVSAMLSKAFPIRYQVWVNDQEVGSGESTWDHSK
jgi:putative redox protein